MKTRDDIRNIAIIAHVDHGKTTLVNELLKQSDTLDGHDEIQDRALDSNQLNVNVVLLFFQKYCR